MHLIISSWAPRTIVPVKDCCRIRNFVVANNYEIGSPPLRLGNFQLTEVDSQSQWGEWMGKDGANSKQFDKVIHVHYNIQGGALAINPTAFICLSLFILFATSAKL